MFYLKIKFINATNSIMKFVKKKFQLKGWPLYKNCFCIIGTKGFALKVLVYVRTKSLANVFKVVLIIQILKAIL